MLSNQDVELARLASENQALRERIKVLESELSVSKSHSVVAQQEFTESKDRSLKAVMVTIFMPVILGMGRILYKAAYRRNY